jgi:hypothetical protein
MHTVHSEFILEILFLRPEIEDTYDQAITGIGGLGMRLVSFEASYRGAAKVTGGVCGIPQDARGVARYHQQRRVVWDCVGYCGSAAAAISMNYAVPCTAFLDLFMAAHSTAHQPLYSQFRP